MKLSIIAVILLTIFVSCKDQEKKKTVSERKSEHEHLHEPKSWKENVSYRIDSLADKPAIDTFFSKYSTKDLNVILALNRIDKKEVRKGTKLIIPDKIFPSFDDYSTFPVELKDVDTMQKFILVSLRNQMFGIYEYGYLVKCGPVSTGKKSAPTPAGKYHTNWKKDVKISTIDPDWIMPWYFNIENKQGIAFHKYELPGYPASHACIRLHEADAIWIYNWADKWILGDQGRKVLKNGTPVVVFGSYDFDVQPVWMNLASDPKAMKITDQEMDEIRELITHPGANKVEEPEIGAP